MKHSLSFVMAALAICATAQQLTLEDIHRKGTYRQESVHGLRSMNDGAHYTTLEQTDGRRSVVKYSYATGEKIETLLSENLLKEWSEQPNATFDGYAFSDDETKMLLWFDQEQIYRHSTVEKYWVVDLTGKKARLLKKEGRQRHATFSPDGAKIAFVEGNDLFVQDYKTEVITPITNDGKQNHIINGFADWVYEEEFSFDKAFFWSPGGAKIAFYKTDESQVREFNMQQFTGLYPEDYRYKYPKAGEANARVSIHIYDVASGKTTPANLSPYEYIPRIKWTETGQYLAALKMPRLQNQLEIVLVETSTNNTRTIYRETSDTYIEIGDDLTFFDGNQGFIIKSEKDGYNHLYRYDFDGRNEKQLTKGPWEVRDFLGYAPSTRQLYFTASPKSPVNTSVYSVSIDGGEIKVWGEETGANSPAFSTTFDYFILYHHDANTPMKVTLHSTTNSGFAMRTLEDNKALREKMATLELATVEFFNFTTSEGVMLNGWMMKPTKMDSKKKYPVLMTVYGGPGSQTVTNAFGGNYWWHQYLCQRGYIVVSVDNRGTGARGRDFRTQTYGQLGKLETQDQIEGARWLAKQPYVDGSRIGIWGWSYGGYMSSLCLLKGADVFKAAVAVAPVTNWRFYDSIYTERYMGLPQDNASGYDDNSPINHADKLRGKYLIIHGTGDDNVHYQNTVEMVDALVKAEKQFDFMAYPERNHGIYGGNTRLHLFTKITDFLMENL